jgi:hypothetical protein
VPGRRHFIRRVGRRWPWIKSGVGSGGGGGGGSVWCDEWMGSSHYGSFESTVESRFNIVPSCSNRVSIRSFKSWISLGGWWDWLVRWTVSCGVGLQI